jgi:enamine deaminase RidA (YjgF/YER057c/UK114 family)
MSNDGSTSVATLQTSASPGLVVMTLSQARPPQADKCQEYFITLVPQGNESAESLLERAAGVIREKNARVISQDIFGIPAKDGTSMQALKDAFGRVDAPVTWIVNGHHRNLGGLHIWAVSGTTVQSLELDGRTIGSVFEDGYGQYCRLGGLLPTDVSRPQAGQAAEIFAQMDKVLTSNGMDFSNVLRTWFYNNDILDWYDDFNEVRSAFFCEKQVLDRLLPASTGIGGRNAAGTALTGGLLALRPTNQDVLAVAVPSPLQDAATEYGSSFSRAVELRLPDHKRLYVSGTASIEANGKTAHVGDPEGQVKLTMEVVYAILKSRAMRWENVTRALAYFKHAKDAPILEMYMAHNKIVQLPIITVENDICRDELLFEIEVDAIQTDVPSR